MMEVLIEVAVVYVRCSYRHHHQLMRTIITVIIIIIIIIVISIIITLIIQLSTSAISLIVLLCDTTHINSHITYLDKR